MVTTTEPFQHSEHPDQTRSNSGFEIHVKKSSQRGTYKWVWKSRTANSTLSLYLDNKLPYKSNYGQATACLEETRLISAKANLQIPIRVMLTIQGSEHQDLNPSSSQVLLDN